MGELTARKFFYKPSLGARGEAEKWKFDEGLDQVDNRLGQEIWLGDPDYSTLSEALTKIGGGNTVLNIPAGDYNISANISMGSNITLVMYPGAVFQVAAGKNLTIGGPVFCLGSSHHFNLAPGAAVACNGPLLSLSSQPFTGSGTYTYSSAPVSLSGTAGETLSAYDLCYLKSDGKYWKADADAASTMPSIALATAPINAEATGTFIRRGLVTNSAWNWSTIGGYIYASTTPGALTQMAPSGSGDQVQIVGIAVSATQIDFDPQLILIEVP